MKSFNFAALALLLVVAAGCKPADSGKSQTAEGSVPATVKPIEKLANKPQVSVTAMPLKQPQNQQLLARLLNSVYGSVNYDTEDQCWRQTLNLVQEYSPGEMYSDNSFHYCMAVARLDKVTIADKTHWYIQMSGDEKTGSHAVMGAMGFFIFDASDETIIASKPLEQFEKEFGEGPGKMALLQLSPNGHFGWLGTSMIQHPDMYAEPAVLMTLKGKSIVNILGNLPETNEDNQQLVKYSYHTDPSQKPAPLYPIIVTEKNTETGKQRKFTANFDRKRWEYRCLDKRCVSTAP